VSQVVRIKFLKTFHLGARRYLAYSKSNDLAERHKAGKVLTEKAWERFHSKYASFGEKASALTVAGIMKGKTKLGMGNRKTAKTSKKVGKPKRKITMPLIPLFAAFGALGSL